MQAEKLKKYQRLLLTLRERLTGEVQHIVESIQQDAHSAGNISRVPVHLGDAYTPGLEADTHLLETEQNILREVEEALARIVERTYGSCAECGRTIPEQRLENIPYTSLCVGCATERERTLAREERIGERLIGET